MKKLKEIYSRLKTHIPEDRNERNQALWQLICYSPKMPVRLHQQELLNEATPFSLTVKDEYFEKRDLTFHGFKWGNGQHKILLTHGWGSKAADLSDIITALKAIDDVTIIAFDAPGNGSSDGALSNLLLFMAAVKAVIANYGEPDVMIGHSLGGMANAMVLHDTGIVPKLLISITPLVRLKENFEATMNSVDVSPAMQVEFFTDFEGVFNMSAADFNLNEKYPATPNLNHWMAYDTNDAISPYGFMKAFLDQYPAIQHKSYDNVGHDKILKSPELIGDLAEQIKAALSLKMPK